MITCSKRPRSVAAGRAGAPGRAAPTGWGGVGPEGSTRVGASVGRNDLSSSARRPGRWFTRLSRFEAWKTLVQPRLAQVAVHDQHGLAELGEDHRQVGRGGGLAFAGHRPR